MERTVLPNGYMQDAAGRLVPVGSVRPIDLLRDDLVRDIIAAAKEHANLAERFRSEALRQICAFVQLSAEEYGAAIGGDKGNITLLSFDGRYKIVRAVAETISFDERLQAAQALIHECLEEWSAGARAELTVIIRDAFQTDKAGKINAARVLALRRYQFEDPRWRRAMDAIGESVQVVARRQNLRCYERDETGQYVLLSLDVSGAAIPAEKRAEA